MNEFIHSEVNFFLASFIWGIILFFVYDVLRILRNVFRHGKAVIAIEDIGFWIMSGILIFRMMYRMNNGTIRWYAVIGIVASMKLYQVLASHYVVSFGSEILLFIKKCIIQIFHWIAAPLLYVFKQIRRFIQWIEKIAGRKIRIVSGFLKKQLKTYQKKVKMKKTEKQRKKQEKIQAQKEPEIVRGVLELVSVVDEKGDRNEESSEKKKKKRS